MRQTAHVTPPQMSATLTVERRPIPAVPILSPLKAIRAKCLDCSCYSRSEVRDCHLRKCPLWPFRMGKNPNRRPRTPEQQLAARESGRRLGALGKAKKPSDDSPAGTPRPIESRPVRRRAEPKKASEGSRKDEALGVAPRTGRTPR